MTNKSTTEENGTYAALRFNDRFVVWAKKGQTQNEWLEMMGLDRTHIHWATKLAQPFKGFSAKTRKEKYLIEAGLKPAYREQVYRACEENYRSLWTDSKALVRAYEGINGRYIGRIYNTSNNIEKYNITRSWRKKYKFLSHKKDTRTMQEKLNNEWKCLLLRYINKAPLGVEVNKAWVGTNFYTKLDTESVRNGRWINTRYKQTFYIPKTWKIKNILEADGILSHIESSHKVGDITVYKVLNIKRHSKYRYLYTTVPGYVASHTALDGSTVYYHGSEKQSVEQVIKGLKNKMVRKTRNSLPNITMDTTMTISKYMRLTGACKPGCQEFCDRFDLSYEAKIKVSELLPMLEAYNAFGLDKLKNILAKDGAKNE